ncbi:MAG: flagellar protein FlaG [Thermodesulfobacterium sp.]|jgi:flagellar protein FlaG|nr:flagellar protein FlaG [Thermodesulfobacterium sp.]
MKVELQKHIVLDPGMQAQQTQQKESIQRVEKAQVSSYKDQTKLSQEELKELSKALNHFLSLFNLETKLVYNKDVGQVVVQVIDKRTNEVIKQIPPEELLEVAKKIHDFVGLLLEKKA